MSSVDNADNLAAQISKIINNLNGESIFYQVKKAAQEEAEKESTMTSSMTKEMKQGLKTSGLDIKLKNEIFQIMLSDRFQVKTTSETTHVEPLAYIRKAQANWERRIAKSINSMCTELNIPLSRRRNNQEERDLLHNWHQLGVDEPDLSKFRPVYAPKDFLEVISGVRNPNYANEGEDDESLPGHWGLIQIPLETPSLSELQEKFSEMKETQMGLDDYMDTTSFLSLQNERIKMAKKVVDSGRSVIAYHFSRNGNPTTSRADMWQLALGVSIDHLDVLRYSQLKQEVVYYDLLIDSLIYKDIKLTAVNDDYYFVFEDYLYQILLIFSRDTTMLKQFENSSVSPPKSYIKGQLGKEEALVTYPPNGVIPFHGFSMYAAPFCYLYRDSSRIYYVFRQFYMRHLHRLHCISSHPEGIVSLCLVFENLLQQLHSRLFRHMIEIGCQPLKIAFKWIMRAFAGYLATDQLFQLWDRIIGYGSLLLLPILSVAIFLFRQANLLSITSPSAIEASLSDLTPIRVVPLLQLIIFPT